MTQDEIIEMARRSSLIVTHVGDPIGINYNNLETFAKLVADKEREACAFLCDELWRKGGWDHNAGFAADCIRAKGKHK